MCGFGVSTIFTVAIAIIVILVILALLRAAFGEIFAGITALPYWNIISIVIAGVIAIIIILLVWRLAECAGLLGRVGLTPIVLPQLAYLGAALRPHVGPLFFEAAHDRF